MKKHTGYTYGTIIKIWDDDGTWYSRYQYKVKGETFQGRQGDKHKLTDTVLIIYDSTNPGFSMIATYPSELVLDSNNNILQLDTTHVSYKWLDYLPGDNIRSLKDIWSLD
jgi:long-subunit fatty acid transport protein